MHDIKLIRENPKAFDNALNMRGISPMSSDILALDALRRERILASETAQAEKNAASKDVGKAKASGDEAEFERLRAIVASKKEEIAKLDEHTKTTDQSLKDLLMGIPNMPFEDTPIGKTEDDNLELRIWGTPKEFDFKPKEHYEIATIAPEMDFETAAKISGSRFVILSGQVARLHRALAQFMLDTHITEHGYTEINAPVIVREDAMLGTGQLPKFSEDSYQTTDGLWLVSTSEIPLTNIVANMTLTENQLPRRFTAHSLCFRSEAGSAGRDTTGMLRQHQFEKIEMVSITRPEDSDAELERMTKCAETILQKLDLPFRTVSLCTGDLGFSARRTYDLEVWLPGQNAYREISSCSVCGDFQARRMNARFKRDGEKKLEYVHSLNGSGLAVGRCLIAVIENHQTKQGTVEIPMVLRPYMGGVAEIKL